MNVRPLAALTLAAVATSVIGLALAQVPAPAAKPAAPTALSDSLPVPPPPQIQGKAWVLMDFATGQVIAGDNGDTQVEPASITKVMTSYVVAAEMKSGKVKGTDPVMMSEHAWREGGAGTEGSYSGFEVNKTAPLVEMEKGMVVQSGNDAAIALAEHVAGSEDAFASLMNAYAHAHRHAALALREPARLVRAGPRLDRARSRAARPRADPRFPRSVFVQQDQGIHGRPDHAAQPQPVAVARSVRRRHQDRPPQRRRLLPDGLGQARRPAPDFGRHGFDQREPARGGFAGAAQLGLPFLRNAPPVRSQQGDLEAEGVEGRGRRSAARRRRSRCW